MFPNYKTKKFLKIIPYKVKDGWEDLGEIQAKYIDGGRTIVRSICTTCHSKARIFRDLEDRTVHKYCPLCLVELK